MKVFVKRDNERTPVKKENWIYLHHRILWPPLFDELDSALRERNNEERRVIARTYFLLRQATNYRVHKILFGSDSIVVLSAAFL